jgi:predicted  nucleic acid-binding Zn-ribbon protein
MQHNSLDALVAGILEACVSPSDSHQLLTYTVLVEQITAALPKCASLQTTLLSAVSSTDIQAKIWKLVQIEVVTEHATCYAYTVSQHQQMVSAMIALLLTLALAVQLAGNTLPLVIITALISKQRQSSHVTSKCSHEVVVVEPSKISLFQQKNTPYTGQHLQDWRGRLKSELESQGFYQRDSIVRSVAQICQDLETRCNTVEEPLRWEKERSQELEHQIVGLRERVASLEIQAADDRFHSEGLEDEKLNISDERDCLSAKLKQLEVETSEATRKAADSLRQVHEEYNAKEMELRSTILIYEESIRAHEEDAEAQNNTLEELRERLQHVQDQRTALSEQHVTLQHRLYDVEEKLGKTSETTRTQAEEIVQFKDRIQELELQLQGTKTELDTITTRLSDLKINHQELIRTSEEAYRYLEDKYTCDMEIATTKAKDDYKTFNARLQEAFQHRKQAENAHDTTRQDLQLLQTSIPPLEAKIQELTTFCAEQEEELDELRTLRKNVLASFGYASQNPLAIRSSSRTQKDAINPQTPRPPREHRRRKSAIQTLDDEPTVPRGAHSITSTAMENIANASFVSSDSYSSQNGSTPKRSKPRPSFKVPAIHTPYTQKPILASRSISKKLSPMKRSALRQMSPNRRHTIVGFAVSENEEMYPNEMGSVSKRHGSLQGVEEADFDTEEFLGGTPMTPENFAAGTGRVPDNDYETTTEL